MKRCVRSLYNFARCTNITTATSSTTACYWSLCRAISCC